MKHLLFNPGPTNVLQIVKEALITQNMSHREQDFRDILKKVNQYLVEILDGVGSHSSVMFVSSGTGANEAIINSIHGKILAINHGRYSERLCDIAKNYYIPVLEHKIPENDLIDLNNIEQILKENNDITHIMLVHHETTTGMLEPLREIGDLARKHNKLIIVDGVSSIGAHQFSLKEDNIAFCSINSNKCFESIPGISFVLVRNKEVIKLKDKSRSFYFNLHNQWNRQQNNEVPFTASIQVTFAMHKALEILKEEGLDNRINRYKRLNSYLRTKLEEMGFEMIKYPTKFTSNVLIVLKLPKNMNYKILHDKMYKQGITIYTNEDSLLHGRFFIASMGAIEISDADYFIDILGKSMREFNMLPIEY